MAWPAPASAEDRESPSSSSPSDSLQLSAFSSQLSVKSGEEMKISRVGVLGAGLMGSGIAEVSAKAGYETIVREVSDELVRKGLSRIEGSLGKAVEKGKLEASARDAARGRLQTTTLLADLADCDIVIEAIVENLETKKE